MDLNDRYRRRLARIIRPMSQEINLAFDANPFRFLEKRFAIACSARTGSYLLCEQLLKHGAVATECFLPDRILSTCNNQGLFRLQDYCQQHLNEAAVGGIFGVKGAFDILVPLVLAGEFPDHLDDWRFVHLPRTDTLKQAISFVIAEQTLAWRSFKAPSKELTDDDFDAARIAQTVKELSKMNRIWNETFTLFGIDPLRITYEQLAADPAGVAAKVAAYLGLQGPPITDREFANPPMERQATELNARWEARFLQDERWRVSSGAGNRSGRAQSDG